MQGVKLNQINLNEDKLPIQKKKFGCLYWVVGIILLFVSVWVYNKLTYPQNETEFINLYCNKYWKPTAYEIEEIYLNDTLVPKESSDVRKSIAKIVDSAYAAKSAQNKLMYTDMQQVADASLNYDDFYITYYNSSQNTYRTLNMEFDTDKEDYYFSETKDKLIETNPYFIFDQIDLNPTRFDFKSLAPDLDAPNINIIKFKNEIFSISSKEMTVRTDLTGKSYESGEIIRIVLKSYYIPTTPNVKYLSALESLGFKP